MHDEIAKQKIFVIIAIKLKEQGSSTMEKQTRKIKPSKAAKKSKSNQVSNGHVIFSEDNPNGIVNNPSFKI